MTELEQKFEKFNTEQKSIQKNLEHWKSQERDYQERINEDAKDLEKMTSKQSLLLKKVCTVFKIVFLLLSKSSIAYYKGNTV